MSRCFDNTEITDVWFCHLSLTGDCSRHLFRAEGFLCGHTHRLSVQPTGPPGG